GRGPPLHPLLLRGLDRRGRGGLATPGALVRGQIGGLKPPLALVLGAAVRHSRGRAESLGRTDLSYELADAAPFADGHPIELYRKLRDSDPVHFNAEPEGGRGFWALTRYDDVYAVD